MIFALHLPTPCYPSRICFFFSPCAHTGWSTPGNRVPFCIVSSSPDGAVVPRLVSYSVIHFFCSHLRTSWSVRYFGMPASSRPPSHPYTPVIVLGVLFNRRQPWSLIEKPGRHGVQDNPVLLTILEAVCAESHPHNVWIKAAPCNDENTHMLPLRKHETIFGSFVNVRSPGG